MENDLLELGEQFRDVVSQKNNQIAELKKFICLIYGLIRACDDNFEDAQLVSLIRSYSSDKIEELLGLDN